MGNDEMCAKEAQRTKVEELIDRVKMINDGASGLRNRLYSMCERSGIQFGPGGVDDGKEPPLYGTFSVLQDEINKVGILIQDAHGKIDELERYI